MLRAGLYYSLNTPKQLVAGGCDKVTQEIAGHGPSHQVPEQSWGPESGPGQADQGYFQGVSILFSGALFESMLRVGI